MISFENVSKKYQEGTSAVDSISFTVHQGEFFVLIGPSGSGINHHLKNDESSNPLNGKNDLYRWEKNK